MGHVYQRVKLSAAKEETLSMLVDTGASYSVISPALADRLGVVRAPQRRTVTLADGSPMEAEYGAIVVQIGDRAAPSTVLIADCPEPLLGVEALEMLGLAVDPATGTLFPTRSDTFRMGGGPARMITS
ncbi:MAG TPA: retropepsin-like aspartic protease [Candidatus Binatia bacterium]